MFFRSISDSDFVLQEIVVKELGIVEIHLEGMQVLWLQSHLVSITTLTPSTSSLVVILVIHRGILGIEISHRGVKVHLYS